ncbi:fungal zn(2)-cys(6) binuclear cluster domain protein [Rhizoctonia solani AG-3 Rhs1AP]|uniref:Fungal zn(2)-cys(6) binuclear cluster domain protein n=2 Tax=Rhizoctonia solani AG-3 TaxID=1086053 RepID=A0A074RMA5_9AGAM|nr:fungal zn(2)-cys(6) binuclear cluster domain protein [Rhizoctonia solani AG-3 Rhs1AP]KEP46480.1 fungal zn(2)-cys(6) binuclear cluster domain protein [Rhizoctonia solani 123E]
MYFTFLTVDIVPGYVRLRKALPSFLHLVGADSTLYSEHPNGNLFVSLPRTLGVPRNELKRFLMYDTATALVLGIPPLVEYGYDGECHPASHGLEWIHGTPLTLVQAIAQVNSWRAGSRVPLNDWRVLEGRVLAWEPGPIVPDDENPGTGDVARLAVQESWRHAVLIYIYMGMWSFIS